MKPTVVKTKDSCQTFPTKRVSMMVHPNQWRMKEFHVDGGAPAPKVDALTYYSANVQLELD